MIKFDKPENLNGSQLRKELIGAGVTIIDSFNSVVIDGNNDMWLEIAQQDKTKAGAIVAAHIAVDESVIRAAERVALLKRLGITADEAALLIS